MVTATLALAGFLVSLYLWLWKLGVVGSLACGPGGGCEYVQTSPYAVIQGIPVAFYGVVGYLALLVVSLVGLQPRWAERREPTLALAALSGLGVAFTAYLKWCLVSAGINSAIFLTSLAGLRAGATPVAASDG
ncbi:MAG: vitamin K epoxide reductase family protein [Gemmatimonadetes bacterium]|nr:vitamin K epoxide reductase family protein [Gemmatimonadota bacterium]